MYFNSKLSTFFTVILRNEKKRCFFVTKNLD